MCLNILNKYMETAVAKRHLTGNGTAFKREIRFTKNSYVVSSLP